MFTVEGRIYAYKSMVYGQVIFDDWFPPPTQTYREVREPESHTLLRVMSQWAIGSRTPGLSMKYSSVEKESQVSCIQQSL